jgi:hypothetical protein
MSKELRAGRVRARHEQPTPIRARLVTVLLGVSWVVGVLMAFAIGFALTGGSGPERPGLPGWQQPGTGAAMVGGGAAILVFGAGAQINLLRYRGQLRHLGRYSQSRIFRSLKYLTIPQALRHNLLMVPIAAALILVGLWLRHRYG